MNPTIEGEKVMAKKIYWRWKDAANLTNLNELRKDFAEMQNFYRFEWIFETIGLPKEGVIRWDRESRFFTEEYNEAVDYAVRLGLIELSDNPGFIEKDGISDIPAEDLLRHVPAWYKNELRCALKEDPE